MELAKLVLAIRVVQAQHRRQMRHGLEALGRPPADLVREFRTLPVPPPVMEKWLFRNAERIFG